MAIPDNAKLERYDDLANTVEELHDENMLLRQAIKQTLDENGHLADGEVCTLLPLKLVLRKIGTPWDGDELWPPELKRKTEAPHNVELTGAGGFIACVRVKRRVRGFYERIKDGNAQTDTRRDGRKRTGANGLPLAKRGDFA